MPHLLVTEKKTYECGLVGSAQPQPPRSTGFHFAFVDCYMKDDKNIMIYVDIWRLGGKLIEWRGHYYESEGESVMEGDNYSGVRAGQWRLF